MRSSLLRLVLCAALTGCAAHQALPDVVPAAADPAAASAAAATAATAAAPSEAPAKTPEVRLSPQPADGKWEVDEDGRRYFLIEVAKASTPYHVRGDGTVQLAHGMLFRLAKEDADTLWLRVDEVTDADIVQPPVEPALDAAAIAKEYAAPGGEVDRLRLVPFSEGLPTSGMWRNAFEVVDFDGDGELDIVHGPPRKAARPRPVVFLGDGKGRWAPSKEVRFPDLPYDYGDVAVADFNQDGRLDLALGVHLRGLLVLVSQPDGGFVRWSEGLEFDAPGAGKVVDAFSSRAVAVTDWNGDGRPDLVALGEGPRMQPANENGVPIPPVKAYGLNVFLNGGDGTWERDPGLPAGGRLFGDDLVLGDLNVDGRPDIAVAPSILGEKEILRLSGPDGWVTTEVPLRRASLLAAVELADLDGDGGLELIVGYAAREGEWRSGIDFYTRRGETWTRTVVGSIPGFDNLWSLAAGDLDGDGDADLAGVTGAGEIWLYLNRGNGVFDREAAPELEIAQRRGCRGYDLHLVDLDGDGADDLLVGFAGEEGSHPLVPQDGVCPSTGSLEAWRPTVMAKGAS